MVTTLGAVLNEISSQPAQSAISAPAAIAEVAPLTAAQMVFRQSRAGGVLDGALPVDVWRGYLFIVRRGQKGMPVARRGTELWYSAEQVVPSEGDVFAPMQVKVLQGGSMGGIRSKRR
jgi:hypothetical protein